MQVSIFVDCQTEVGYWSKDAERMLVRANGTLVGDSVGRRKESTCMKIDSVVTKLNKVAERILDRTNGKHCQRQFRAKASEHICGLIMESMQTS